jgi:polar amino acid transport system substrate-binding protein
VDRDKVLEVTLQQIEKQHGRGAVMKLGEHPMNVEIQTIPTGSLALDIAKQLKITNVEFRRAPFSTILLAGKKSYDFALEETTITPARARVISFSASYFSANQGVLISKATPKPKAIADLKSLQPVLRRRRRASTGSSTSCARRRSRSSTRPRRRPHSTRRQSGMSGPDPRRRSSSRSQKKPGAYGGVVAQIDTHEGYGAVMEKNSPLKPYVSKAINALQKNGTIGKLIFRWFGYYPYRIPVLK